MTGMPLLMARVALMKRPGVCRLGLQAEGFPDWTGVWVAGFEQFFWNESSNNLLS